MSSPDAPLDGRVALVTGASRGIGRAIALDLARLGADVAVVGRSTTARAGYPGSVPETVAAVEALGRRACGIVADVLVDADLQRMVDTTLTELGRLDFLINNAAHIESSPIDTDGVAVLERSWAANVRAPMLLTKLALPALLASRGAVVNISSGAASHPRSPSEAAPDAPRFHAGPEYGMTKAALDRFTTGIAEQLADRGVAAVSVWPGFTLTERNQARDMPGVDKRTALPMWVTSRTVADLCCDPMRHTGRIVVARDHAAAHQLTRASDFTDASPAPGPGAELR